jgi:hypothetical protein
VVKGRVGSALLSILFTICKGLTVINCVRSRVTLLWLYSPIFFYHLGWSQLSGLVAGSRRAHLLLNSSLITDEFLNQTAIFLFELLGMVSSLNV